MPAKVSLRIKSSEMICLVNYQDNDGLISFNLILIFFILEEHTVRIVFLGIRYITRYITPVDMENLI